MHIVIMGCGRVGSTLAHGLDARGHSVAVIDRNPDAFRRLAPDFSGRTVNGVGFDRQTLLEAGITEADAFAAVSSGDNSNIIAARVARETFGVDNVVARIYDPGRAEVYERLGIPTVATVRWTANRMIRAIDPHGAAEVWREPTSAVALVEVTVDERWVGRRVHALEQAMGVRVAWVVRFGVAELVTDSTAVQDGDQVFVLVTDELLPGVLAAVGEGPEGGS